MAEERNRRVLTIQSHVVSGYCGNKAATFPLQTLGFEVDVMNTVEFSNHTGYPSWGGRRVPAEELKDLFDGMEKNGLVDDYTHLLTGYIGVAASLRVVVEMAEELKRRNPKLMFVCDPVMGDDGELYVSNEVVPLYRQIMRLADVVTPNQFEAETLASTSITSLATAHQTLSLIHDLGPTYVVITTVSLPIHHLNPSVSISSSPTPPLFCLGSHRATPTATPRQFFVSFPTYPGYFTGTGDLFSALLVARLTEALEEEEAGADTSDLSPLARAVLKVVASVSQVVKRTRERQKNFVVEGGGKPGEAEIVRRCELQVVQGKKEIENPVVGADITFGML